MFVKYAEIKYRLVLYNACKGLLRVKEARSKFNLLKIAAINEFQKQMYMRLRRGEDAMQRVQQAVLKFDPSSKLLKPGEILSFAIKNGLFDGTPLAADLEIAKDFVKSMKDPYVAQQYSLAKQHVDNRRNVRQLGGPSITIGDHNNIVGGVGNKGQVNVLGQNAVGGLQSMNTAAGGFGGGFGGPNMIAMLSGLGVDVNNVERFQGSDGKQYVRVGGAAIPEEVWNSWLGKTGTSTSSASSDSSLPSDAQLIMTDKGYYVWKPGKGYVQVDAAQAKAIMEAAQRKAAPKTEPAEDLNKPAVDAAGEPIINPVTGKPYTIGEYRAKLEADKKKATGAPVDTSGSSSPVSPAPVDVSDSSSTVSPAPVDSSDSSSTASPPLPDGFHPAPRDTGTVHGPSDIFSDAISDFQRKYKNNMVNEAETDAMLKKLYDAQERNRFSRRGTAAATALGTAGGYGGWHLGGYLGDVASNSFGVRDTKRRRFNRRVGNILGAIIGGGGSAAAGYYGTKYLTRNQYKDQFEDLAKKQLREAGNAGTLTFDDASKTKLGITSTP